MVIVVMDQIGLWIGRFRQKYMGFNLFDVYLSP